MFRPEFLNRTDDIVLFKPLTRQEVKEIVKLVLKSLSSRLAEKDMDIEYTDKAMDYIVDEGWNPEFGARTIKRFVQKHVETGSGRLLIKGDIETGDTVLVDADENGLVISRKA